MISSICGNCIICCSSCLISICSINLCFRSCSIASNISLSILSSCICRSSCLVNSSCSILNLICCSRYIILSSTLISLSIVSLCICILSVILLVLGCSLICSCSITTIAHFKSLTNKDQINIFKVI